MSLLDFLISPAAAAPAAGTPPGGGLLGFAPLIIIFVLMYFMIIRPQSKRAKEHREMVSKLAKGDEILTTGGIAGRITDVGDDFVTVEVAEKVAIKVQRGAVSAVLPKGTLKAA
ncbi:preprotein translocase subunit YajC [Arenimonas composti]|uniref:Sec translocon accessory complex subunit YajC n=1 Tax=Arenimonas composti TR7-09 = DSM 18010 TaxID=1121013 RepID=A0A091BEI4_9GAMM|nr:preprotein translocase subunit YajC [Arenimonas composti]KFN49229.1 hypothetical protein P873_11735 [Arenimonas composti TR7-09 = DSM 18010]